MDDERVEEIATYWDHCRWSDGDLPWTLKNEPGRGNCAYANRDFKAGEVILVETPTVWFQGHHPFTDKQIEELERRVSELGQRDKKGFYEMANSFPEMISKAAAIFMTNSFDMADSPLGDCCAIYAAIGRLNHSCVPNAQQTHLPETSEEVLVASRAIAAGEEICDCYIDLRAPRSERRKTLQELYCFDCNCPSCCGDDGDSETDDLQRLSASHLDSAVFAAAEEDPELALGIALDYLKLLQQESAQLWSVRYLSEAHFNIYLIAEALDNSSMAMEHLQAAHQWNLRLQGPDSPDSRRTEELLKSKSRKTRIR